MSVREIQDKGGFWLANEIVDDHLEEIKARGLVLYCLIARSCTRWDYPTMVDLKDRMRCSEKVINDTLERLYACGLLNDHDLATIRGEIVGDELVESDE